MNKLQIKQDPTICFRPQCWREILFN